MSEPPPETNFVAVLVFERTDGWAEFEPHVYRVSHPEIAYRLALAEGKEPRNGSTFLGLSHLEEPKEIIEAVAEAKKGNARAFVTPKENLAAFADPRWRDLPCDEADLAAALSGPEVVFEVEGLDAVAWRDTTHAYGRANDVKRNIRLLAAKDAAVRELALWRLYGSINHQGSVYPATAAVLPVLLRAMSDDRLPEREEVGMLLRSIAESCAVKPEQIRKTWTKHIKHASGSLKAHFEERMSCEIETREIVRSAYLQQLPHVRQLCVDRDPAIRKVAKSILERFENE